MAFLSGTPWLLPNEAQLWFADTLPTTLPVAKVGDFCWIVDVNLAQMGVLYIATAVVASTGAVTWVQCGGTNAPSVISADGAISPNTAATYIVTKAGVAAMTLAAPTVGTDDGKIIKVVSSTANAHTITATGLLQTGSAAVNTATFAASAGASITLMAYNGKWTVLASNGITFA